MNALLSPWNATFSLPPFAEIRDEHFAPAFDAALAEARANIGQIAANPDAPTFANTIDEPLLMTREALMRDLAPKLSAFSSEVTNNKSLFSKIETLWQNRATLSLTPEQSRVLELYRQMFVRSGANLDGAEAARLTDVKARLAVLGTQFSQNLLGDER
ncbi:MAG: hypothetical protein RI979_1805, partial [Pseudomonadota bacterium]